MDSAFRTAIPELSLAAIAQLSENSRLGFATRNPALYRGIEWSKSTLALGLPEWAGKTASGPVVAANNGNNAFGGIPNAPAVVGSRTQDCYNDFHHTTAGKIAQLGSLTALTPADPEFKSNWEETLGLGTLKALLVGGAAGSEIGVISAVGHFAENAAAKLATPVLFTATAVDTGALTMCAARAVSSLGSGW